MGQNILECMCVFELIYNSSNDYSFDGLIAKARKSAKKVGLKKSDINDVVAKVRSDKWKLGGLRRVRLGKQKAQGKNINARNTL